jgi:predicted RNA-binding Zn-ribbon protein involved in translation (DUF1610 family)
MPDPIVVDITGGPLSPEERAIHAKYQGDDPAVDYYDPCPIPPGQGMQPTADTGDLWVCGGCGITAPRNAEGWRHTDAPWCPKCGWLA